MTGFDKALASLVELQGRITLDKRHCYRLDGKYVPGVTTIIKAMDAPMLDAWKVKIQVEGTARAAHANPPMFGEPEEQYVARLVSLSRDLYEHERIASQAADLGSQVHALIEHAVKSQLGIPMDPPEATDEALFIFAGWREWAERVNLEPLMAEGRVYNSVVGYCGTFDLLARVDGSPAILDWKPQARVYPERRLQSAAYRAALTDSLGFPPLAGYIVAMPKDGGEIEAVPMDDGEGLHDAYVAFQACCELYRWQRALSREKERAVA